LSLPEAVTGNEAPDSAADAACWLGVEPATAVESESSVSAGDPEGEVDPGSEAAGFCPVKTATAAASS
jgi:hypothetical protein